MIQNYYRASDAADAFALKKAHSQAVFLAGGTQINRESMYWEMPETVIDIRGALSNEIAGKESEIVIGAMATLQDVADNVVLPSALREAAAFIPTRSIRNQASIGGNIGAGCPDSYIIPTLFALSATLDTARGRLQIEEYLEQSSSELIYDIRLPKLPASVVAVKESRSHIAPPVVSAAVSLRRDGSKRLHARVALGCVASKTLRLRVVERELESGTLKKREDMEKAIGASISPRSDILGSAEYKTHINSVLVADAIFRCLEEFS